MDDGSCLTLLETLDSKIADAIERALQAKAISVRRSRVSMTLADQRLRQLGTRLEVSASDGDAAKAILDEILMRRARLLAMPSKERIPETGDAGGSDYVGGFESCGGDGGPCD